ncbi:Mannose-P-dolichol utilization defect 1 protein-like [Porphyridium purpureum]|uniref:Mannose-P-dolichol utilization defect 1 protein-like n=1 Tax=Porphyridium purpureum TaxID=35688 RepID=A0A5J4Z522_PORPP|nr:Mannose-P-dolichol utilization defect 1 protein-like [Porphyridium purpureum]|eukprot:POR3865..scf295_1
MNGCANCGGGSGKDGVEEQKGERETRVADMEMAWIGQTSGIGVELLRGSAGLCDRKLVEWRSSGRVRGLCPPRRVHLTSTPLQMVDAAAAVVLSRVVGVAVLLGSVMYKVPQVLRIVKSKSTDGISTSALVYETLGMLFSSVYNVRSGFPFETYGELIFITLQNILILWLMRAYAPPEKKRRAALAPILIGTSFPCLMAPVVPFALTRTLQLLSIPLGNLSRLPQIWMSFRSKSTGQLSVATVALTVAGNVARLFTTAVQVKDAFVLMSSLCAFALNSVVLTQCILYNKMKPGSDKEPARA